MEADCDSVGVSLALCVALSLGDCEADWLEETDADALCDWVSLALELDDALWDAESDADCDADIDADCDRLSL